MAGFGGAVKLTGESEYRKALKQINQSLKETSADLKLVTAQYANNDKSISALTAKQSALNKQLDAQTQKVKTLTSQYNSMSAQYKQNLANHASLTTALEVESKKLKDIEQESGKTSKEYQAQAEVVSNLASEVTKSSKNIEQNETALSKMRVELTNATTEMTKTENELNNMDGAIQDATKSSEDLASGVEDSGKKAEDAANGGFTVFKGVLADLTSTAIKGAIDGLKNLTSAAVSLGKDAIASYADYEQLVGGVETLFGTGGKTIEEYAKSVGKSTSEVAGEYSLLENAQRITLANAAKAYKTAGMSANDYMENVTSFSASLISSLDGDTFKAAQAADRAIQDMSDNANKMGTDIGSIQNAYQGFAKQNYTMLDNLKLGYGGTKEEMERLLADAEKLSGQKYDISNLNDVYDAIHVVQTEMGITGTTAKEAASTISGSTAMMSSAWQNLLTGIADDNADFDNLINDFIESVMTVADNLVPRIQTTIQGMAKLATSLLQKLVPQVVAMIPPLLQSTLPMLISAVKSVLDAVLAVLPEILPVIAELIPQIVTTIVSLLPDIVSAGIDILLALIDGITETIPELLDMLPDIIESIVNTLIDKLPDIIDTGINLLMALINGIVKAIPKLVKMLPTIIGTIVGTLIANLPKIIDMGVNILIALINGLAEAIPDLIAYTPRLIKTVVDVLIQNLPQMIATGKKILKSLIEGISSMMSDLGTGAKAVYNKIKDTLKDLPDAMKTIGGNIMKGLWSGVSGLKDWVIEKVKGMGKSILNGLKSALGIKSPSRVFKEQVGKNIALGIGVGFTEEMKDVTKEMQDALPTLDVDEPNFDFGGSIKGVGATLGYADMVKAFKEALSDVYVELDDQKVGKFVTKVVTKAIYT